MDPDMGLNLPSLRSWPQRKPRVGGSTNWTTPGIPYVYLFYYSFILWKYFTARTKTNNSKYLYYNCRNILRRQSGSPYIPFAAKREDTSQCLPKEIISHQEGCCQTLDPQISCPPYSAISPEETEKKYNAPWQKISDTSIQQLFNRYLLNKKHDFRHGGECRAQGIVLLSRS